jgi:hypothetical protein
MFFNEEHLFQLTQSLFVVCVTPPVNIASVSTTMHFAVIPQKRAPKVGPFQAQF